MNWVRRFNLERSKSIKIAASIVLSTAMFGSIVSFAMPSKAYASSALPLATNAVNGSGWSIDGNGNLTINAGQTVDLDSIVSVEWSGQTYNPNTPPTFNNVTVDGTLTTSSSYHDLVFDAQGTVTVPSGGTINMTGMSPGVTGANGTGVSGGAGVDGNGGSSDGVGGTKQSNQLYGGNGGQNASPSNGVGGGHIEINANDIEIQSAGRVLDDGTVGVGGVGASGSESEPNGSGGGGGGLTVLNAPTINIASGSDVEATGGGGGGGAGAPSTSASGVTPILLNTTLAQPSNTGQSGKNGSGTQGGSGGNGGNANGLIKTPYPQFVYNYFYRGGNSRTGFTYNYGIKQAFSSLSIGDSDGGYQSYWPTPHLALGYLTDGRILMEGDFVYNSSGGNYTQGYAVSQGQGQYENVPLLNGQALYGGVGIRNGVVYAADTTGLYSLNVASWTWKLVAASPTLPSGYSEYPEVVGGNEDMFVIPQFSWNGSYEYLQNVYYWDWQTSSWSLGGSFGGTSNYYRFFVTPSGSFYSKIVPNTGYMDNWDAELGDWDYGWNNDGSVWWVVGNAPYTSTSYTFMSYDPTTNLALFSDYNNTTSYYLVNASTDAQYTVSMPSGSELPSTATGYTPTSMQLFDGNVYVTGSIAESSGNVAAGFVESESSVESNTSSWSQRGVDLLPFPNLSQESNVYNSSMFNQGVFKSPLSISDVQMLAGPSGGAGATQSGTQGATGGQNTSSANGTSILASEVSGDGGSAGGNGGTTASPNGQNGGSALNASTDGTSGGSGGYGGGGGGAGEVELESTNPSGINGASNVTNTPTVIAVPNTLKTISLNQGALYSQSATVSVSYSGADMASNETLEIAQDSGFTQNVKKFSINGTANTVGTSTYYSYSGQVQYAFSGVALNQPATMYARLIDSNGASNVLSSAITPILDTTPPTVSVTIDANQTSTTKLPLQVSTVANDPVSAQGMQMLYSPDGETWYNVVTKPLSTSTVDANGSAISSALVTATANASTSNPVFVQAQSATDVQPYSSFVNGFEISSTPKVVDEQGNTVSANIWSMDTTLTPNQIKSGEYYAYVLVQDANKNQATGANAIYYQNNGDTPSNPAPGTGSGSGTGTGSGSGSGSSSTTGLVNNNGSSVDLSGNTVSISGSWSNISSGSTTWTDSSGNAVTMSYGSTGLPSSPVAEDGEVIDWKGQPTIVTTSNTVPIDIPVSSATTQFKLSTDNGQHESSWQTISGGNIQTTANLLTNGLQSVGVQLGNGQVASNWLEFPVLVDNNIPHLSVNPTLGGGGVTAGSQESYSVSVTDDLSGIPLYYQTIVNGGTPSAWSVLPKDHQVSVTIPNQGVNSVEIVVEDLAGNTQEQTLHALGL